MAAQRGRDLLPARRDSARAGPTRHRDYFVAIRSATVSRWKLESSRIFDQLSDCDTPPVMPAE